VPNARIHARSALARLCETTRASGTDWGLGTEARSRALLSEGQAAENSYQEAIERLGRTRMRPAAARARLLYGEWLRREPPGSRSKAGTAPDGATGRSAWPYERIQPSPRPSRFGA
jgi:hypothetical protein